MYGRRRSGNLGEGWPRFRPSLSPKPATHTEGGVELCMPLARYFLLVGGALLLALLVAGAVLPSPQAIEHAETKRAEIHIHSAMKLPERVVFDTSAPAVAPRVEAVMAETAPPS